MRAEYNALYNVSCVHTIPPSLLYAVMCPLISSYVSHAMVMTECIYCTNSKCGLVDEAQWISTKKYILLWSPNTRADFSAVCLCFATSRVVSLQGPFLCGLGHLFLGGLRRLSHSGLIHLFPMRKGLLASVFSHFTCHFLALFSAFLLVSKPTSQTRSQIYYKDIFYRNILFKSYFIFI